MQEKYRNNVGIVLINKEKKVFVARRSDIKEPAWQMPQGGVDEGEDLKTAALRELEEETSIKSVKYLTETKGFYYYDFPISKSKNLYKGEYKGQKQKWFLFLFLGNQDEIDLDTKHPEFIDYKWTDRKWIIKEIIDFKKDIYDRVFKEFNVFFD
jgi:putative (di)nucleoside polyphosphate hydrolase